jgi:hypothetical protein
MRTLKKARMSDNRCGGVVNLLVDAERLGHDRDTKLEEKRSKERVGEE